jgi:hypothetical protein
VSNTTFAFKLYRQLAKENAGRNLFFSPYSISSALAMTVEGARGETALEMGQVLGFPDEVRNVGDEARMLPWRMALIHAGMSELNHHLSGGIDPASLERIREEIDSLRLAFEAAEARTSQAREEQ